MFTGIVELIGTVRSVKKGAHSSLLEIGAEGFLGGTRLGDSIAVNGVCLTVTRLTEASFHADAVAETLRQSNLGLLGAGARVNLEKALTLQKPLGGHLVSGHIDGTGRVFSIIPEDKALWLGIRAEPEILKYIVGRGSITVDGVSLTAAHVDRDHFKVSLIPHTGSHTTLFDRKIGDLVNLECDIIGKYVEKLMGLGQTPGLTKDFFKKNGF